SKRRLRSRHWRPGSAHYPAAIPIHLLVPALMERVGHSPPALCRLPHVSRRDGWLTHLACGNRIARNARTGVGGRQYGIGFEVARPEAWNQDFPMVGLYSAHTYEVAAVGGPLTYFGYRGY